MELLQQDLGLEESNKGVFDGSWKGSGEVKVKYCGITNKIEGILSFGSVLQFDQNIEKISISYSRQQCRRGIQLWGGFYLRQKFNLHMFFFKGMYSCTMLPGSFSCCFGGLAPLALLLLPPGHKPDNLVHRQLLNLKNIFPEISLGNINHLSRHFRKP